MMSAKTGEGMFETGQAEYESDDNGNGKVMSATRLQSDRLMLLTGYKTAK